MSSIGQLNETDLHEQLKRHYAGTKGSVEVHVDGFVVDVALPGELVEIQTRGLGKLRRKIERLRDSHQLRIVYPVAVRTQLIKLTRGGAVASERRSPKRGRMESVFRELASIADMLPHRNVTIEVVLLDAVERRIDDGKGSWRRRGVSILSRALAGIRETVALHSARDYLALLPAGLPDEFTNRDLAGLAGLPYSLAQPVTSSLRKMGLIVIAGKRGRELVYTLSE